MPVRFEKSQLLRALELLLIVKAASDEEEIEDFKELMEIYSLADSFRYFNLRINVLNSLIKFNNIIFTTI